MTTRLTTTTRKNEPDTTRKRYRWLLQFLNNKNETVPQLDLFEQKEVQFLGEDIYIRGMFRLG